jgi:hypothetical protein
MIVAYGRGYGAQESGFAVGAGPIKEKQCLLLGRAGQRIANHTLQVGNEVGFVVGNTRKKFEPKGNGTRTIGQQPRISVPLINGRSKTTIRSCQPFDAAYGVRTFDLSRIFHLSRSITANLPRVIGRQQGVVELPPRVIPRSTTCQI